MSRIVLPALSALLLVPAPARALTGAAATRGAVTTPGGATLAGTAAALNAVRGTTGFTPAALGGLLAPTFPSLLLPKIDLTLPTLSSVYQAAERFKARVLANVARVFSTDQSAADYQPSQEVLEAARAVNSHKRAPRIPSVGAGRGQGHDSFAEVQAAQAAAAGMDGKANGAREQAHRLDRRLKGIGQGGPTEDLLRIGEASFDGSST